MRRLKIIYFSFYVLLSIKYTIDCCLRYPCMSLLFIARSVRITRIMLSQDVRLSVCPSVRPSVTRRCCVETAKCIFELFSPSTSRTLFWFSIPNLRQYSDWDPLTRALNAGEVRKKSRFRPISHFISELVQDGAIVTIERQ